MTYLFKVTFDIDIKSSASSIFFLSSFLFSSFVRTFLFIFFISAWVSGKRIVVIFHVGFMRAAGGSCRAVPCRADPTIEDDVEYNALSKEVKLFLTPVWFFIGGNFHVKASFQNFDEARIVVRYSLLVHGTRNLAERTRFDRSDNKKEDPTNLSLVTLSRLFPVAIVSSSLENPEAPTTTGRLSR